MTRIRLLLNSPFTGANAFFALAQARGLFAAAGLEVECTAGRGAYTAAGRLHTESFDAAYGDINALLEYAALHPAEDTARAVCVVHQQSPAVIAVDRRGPVHAPAALAGTRLIGHASDVALQIFGAYAAGVGVQTDMVQVECVDAPMADLLGRMLAGQADGVFGYATTHNAALAGAGVDATERLRFLPFRDACPFLYGSALMASARFQRDQPQALRALVGCVLAGIAAARAEPNAAIAAAVRFHPALSEAAERARWDASLRDDIDDIDGRGPQGGGTTAAPGDADEARLARSIDQLAAAKDWPSRPRVDQVFTRDFLPAPGG